MYICRSGLLTGWLKTTQTKRNYTTGWDAVSFRRHSSVTLAVFHNFMTLTDLQFLRYSVYLHVCIYAVLCLFVLTCVQLRSFLYRNHNYYVTSCYFYVCLYLLTFTLRPVEFSIEWYQLTRRSNGVGSQVGRTAFPWDIGLHCVSKKFPPLNSV